MSVEEILLEIEALGEEDRLKLERELARRLEDEWKREASAARATAQSRGIDQAAIDQAIERRRYGK